jgi:hypothetical protein
MKSLENESTSRYEHIDMKNTLNEAMVKKIHLPKDSLIGENIKLLASCVLNI